MRKASDHEPASLTFKQVEKIATLTGYPLGFFFMDASPAIAPGIPDLRKSSGARLSRPLCEQIRLSRARSRWYRNYALSEKMSKAPCAGSIGADVEPEDAARECDLMLGVSQLREDLLIERGRPARFSQRFAGGSSRLAS